MIEHGVNANLNNLEHYHKSMGIKKFSWISAHDKSTCDFCNKRGGHIMTYEEIKQSILESPNFCANGHCRCTISPLID